MKNKKKVKLPKIPELSEQEAKKLIDCCRMAHSDDPLHGFMEEVWEELQKIWRRKAERNEQSFAE